MLILKKISEVVIYLKLQHVANNSAVELIMNSVIDCWLESVCTLHCLARNREPQATRFCAIFISQKQLKR